MISQRPWILFLFVLAACGDDDRRPSDAGSRDGGGRDAAVRDGGRADGGRDDGGGPLDGGSDAGLPDAGADAGLTIPCSPPVPVYTAHFPGSDNQQIIAATVDSTGAVLFTGRNQGVVDFGGDPLDAGATHGLFVAKLDATGAHVFSVQFEDAGDDTEPYAIVAAPGDRVIVSGYVKGAIDFGAGPVMPTVGPSLREIFVLVLDGADGSLVWSRRYGMGNAWAATTGPDGDVYIAGEASGTNDFGGGPRIASGQSDIFLVRLSSEGVFEDAALWGGSRLDVAYGVAVDSAGAAYLTGQSYGELDFGMGAEGMLGENHFFVAKVDATLAGVFQTVVVGPASGYTLLIAPDDGVYLQRPGQVQRLAPDGSPRWSEPITGSALPRAMARDGSGGLWVTGSSATGCPSAPGSGVYAQRLDEVDGSPLDSLYAVAGASTASLWSVGVTPARDVVVAGWYGGSGLDFGDGPLGASMSADAIVVSIER